MSRDGNRIRGRAGYFTYDLDTVLTVEVDTGKVRCDLPGLAGLAQEHLDHCTQVRTGGDVTRTGAPWEA